MTRGETRPSRGVGIDRSRAAAAVLVALAACAVGARAHIDPDDPDQLVHKPWEEHARPSPPPPALDHDAVLGGVYDTPLLLREDQEYELMCSVIVKPPGFMYVAPNVTINVRGNCEGADATAWNVINPGGSGMKPSIVILPGARLDVRGTPEKPVVIKKKKAPGSDPSGTTRGDWGGVYMFGRARVSYGANEPGQMKVGTVPGATTESTVGLDASQKFVARHAPEATFPACDDGHGQPYGHRPNCTEFQPSKDLAGDGYLDSHFRRFEYGGDDDAGSCGSLENLVVVNAGGGDSSSVTRPVALGLYGCGVATTLRNVEVAHADGVGIDLRGGAALVRDVAVWSVTSHAISASGGYRGAMRNVFVDVDGAEPVSALRVEGDLDAGEGATQYRTHPHVYSSTLVASGDDDGYYASLAATGAPPAAVATGIVSAANGAGLTLVNSIVLSRSIRRSRGVEVSGCSNEMDVGNEAAIGAPDLRGAAEATPSAARLFVSDRNVIAGFGTHPADASFGAFPTSMREVLDTTGEYHYVGSITKRREFDEFDETWLGANAVASDQNGFVEVTPRDWRAFGLSAGCEYKLNLADDKMPQLRSMFFPSDAPSAVRFLDPRPTELMRDAHKVDQPSTRASRGFALTTALPTTLTTTKAAIDAFLSEPVEFPGAFTLNASSVWFGPSVRNEPPAVQGATLTSAYAHFRMFATATASSSGSTSGKRKLLSTESRGELESLIRRLARPTTRARGSGDAISDTAPGASRSLLFFGGGDTSGVTGAYGSAATVCPAWEKFAICDIFGSESADECTAVADMDLGVICQYDYSDEHCIPANSVAEAYVEMLAKINDAMDPLFSECFDYSTNCGSNSKCILEEYDGSSHCTANFASAAAVDAVSTALENDGANALATGIWSLLADFFSCDHLSDQASCDDTAYCTWGEHDMGVYECGIENPALIVRDAASLCTDVSDGTIGSFSTLMSMFSGGSGSAAAVPEAEPTRLYAHFRMFATATASSSGGGDWCDAPLVNVVVEQNACYRAPKWFTDKTSPSSGTARSGNFDPSTAWRAFDAFDEDETSDDDVVADVPQTLGHLLLDDAAFDSDTDSWAHGSVVAQLVADAALVAYKRGARSADVGADIAVVRAAHVAGDIPAGKFTRGNAATTLSSPDATFKVADMTGADIKTLLTNGATASESSQFAYAAGARFSFDKTAGTASDFEVLADGSDREWTALVDAKTYKVILAGTETQTGTDVLGTMRDIFFEYAMSVGVLLRPPPRSRSLRELTTSAGIHAHDFHPEAAAHMKLVVQNGSDPALRVYSSLAACESDSSGSGGDVAAEGLFVEDPGDPCAHGEVDIVQVDILPGSIPSDNLVVTEEWTDALECPRDAETNARTPAMFTFYNAAGDAPAYVFDGVQPRSAPEAEESVASGRRKLLSSSSATQCAANEHVQSGICVACPSGKIKAAGDDPSGPDTECYNPGITVRDGGDVAGSPCYHILGAETGSRRGTQRFFCDASGSLTAVKWFTGSDGELKNPSCDVSAVPDEISYGAHRINFRNDLASCDAPSAFDAARSLAFPKLEGSCGSLAHAAAYARLDGRAGPFASGMRYAFPYAQRLEGAPWGCSTDDCNRARELGYKI